MNASYGELVLAMRKIEDAIEVAQIAQTARRTRSLRPKLRPNPVPNLVPLCK